jgi:hypothetical protein
MLPRTRKRARAAAVLAVAAAVTGLVVGVGAGTAAAHDGSITTHEVFRSWVKPWETIQIPQLSCPPGTYLENRQLAPGRIVPKGLEVVEPGGIGVTINEVTKTDVLYEGTVYNMHTGTDPDRLYSISSATNWDLTSGHELVINLRCTNEFVEGAHGEWN